MPVGGSCGLFNQWGQQEAEEGQGPAGGKEAADKVDKVCSDAETGPGGRACREGQESTKTCPGGA